MYNKIKKHIHNRVSLIATLLVAAVIMTACHSDEEETVTYNDAAITSFSLGTLPCVRTVKKADGTDSAYVYTYSGSAFSMQIDHARGEIYNLDSLVVGTQLSHVLVDISTKNGGTVYWQNLYDDGLTYYSSTDSVDLSCDRTLIVYSSDGTQERRYTVRLTVHNEYADAFTWSRQTVGIASELAAMKRLRATVLGGTVYLLGSDDAGSRIWKSADGASWSELASLPVTPLTAEASLVEYAGALYLLDGGTLYSSADGETFAEVASGLSVATLIGGYANAGTATEQGIQELYALTVDGRIMVSADGMAWEEDKMEGTTYYDNTAMMPYSDINFVANTTKTNGSIGNVTIVANSKEAAANAAVWNKIVDADDDSQTWFYTNPAWNNHYYLLPQLAGLTATWYAEGIVATGGDCSKFYFSPDHGATWHTGLPIPTGFTKTNAACVVADGKGYIYLISDGNGTEGQVWRGRKNRLTWKYQQTVFQ